MQVNNEPVPNATRQQVILRANYRCEYCLLDESVSFLGFEVDHIISRKHRGSNHPDNLAYACPDCNRNKGTDIASIDWSNHEIVRFYNSRTDDWAIHFRFNGAVIEPTSPIGLVTTTIFRFNDPDRVLVRGRLN